MWILQGLAIGFHEWLMTGSHEWLMTGKLPKAGTCVKHAEELKSHASCCNTGQNSQASQAISSRLELATQSSREAKSPKHSIWEKLTFHIPKTHQYCKKNLREKQDWPIHNLHPLIFQIPLLSPSPLLHL